MQIDPRHLIQLATIVQCGSFGAAAAKLNVAQPALSKSMKKLEERLGAPIFERIGRQSVATDLGTTFARFGLMMLAAEDQARAYAQHLSTGQAGSLLIGTAPSLADNLLAPILSDFLASHVGCRVELRVGLLAELETQLSTGQVNLVIGPARPLSADLQLETETLADDMLGIVCRKGHALTRQAEILPRDLEAVMILPADMPEITTAEVIPLSATATGRKGFTTVGITDSRHFYRDFIDRLIP